MTVPIFFIVLGEFICLVLILKYYIQDQTNHKRWLEYRHLSEVLRPMQYLSLLGRTNSISQDRINKGLLNHNITDPNVIGQAWPIIYIETINRWAGFNQCTLNQPYKKSVHKFIKETWLKGQINYHKKNAADMSRLEQRLKKLNHLLFFITATIVFLKLIVSGIKWMEFQLTSLLNEVLKTASDPLTLLAILLPIVATAVFAIRNQAGFAISEQHSLTIYKALVQLDSTMPSNITTLTSGQIASDMHQIAAITTRENTEWLEIFKMKKTEI